VNQNYKDGQVAYFAARAGLQEARARIRTPAGDLNAKAYALTMPSGNPLTTTGGFYIVNPNNTDGAINPWDPTNKYYDDTLCKSHFPGLGLTYGTQNTHCTAAQAPPGQWTNPNVASQDLNSGTAASMQYKWVRVTLKSNRAGSPKAIAGGYPYVVDTTALSTDNRYVCWTGSAEMLLPAGYTNCQTPPGTSDPYRPVFLLAVMALTPTGAQRTLSMEVADDPPLIVKGAVVSNDVIDTVGSSAGFIGQDNCNCKCNSSGVCTNRVGGGTCSSGYSAITTSQTINSSGNPTITAPTTTPATPVDQTGVTPFPYDVNTLINRFKGQSSTVNASGAPYNLTCSGTPVSCGNVNTGTFGTVPSNFSTLQTDGAPVGNIDQTTYVGGNLDLYAHNTGAGILVVDGDLTIHGGLQFYGLIIVRGAVTFTGGGSGGGSNVIGAVLAGQSAQADTLGGSAQFQFDSCALANAQVGQPPHVLATREIEY
jgi:hypothetical protein